MARIKHIEDTEGNIIFPITHERAVRDDSGVTLESKLQMQQAMLNQNQMEIGAVPSDNTPTENSTNWVTSGGLYLIKKKLEDRFGNYYLDESPDAVQTLSEKYVGKGGGIANSSTETMTVAFYEIPSTLKVDSARVIIPKTGNSSTRVVSWAQTLNQSKVSSISGVGNSKSYDNVVDISSVASYIVLCYDSASGNPTIYFHIAPAEDVDVLYTDFSKQYDNNDCKYLGYLNSSGTVTSSSVFRYSDYLNLYSTNIINITYPNTTSAARIVAYYDSSKTFISAIAGGNQNGLDYLIPSNAKYIRICRGTDTNISITISSDELHGFLSYLESSSEDNNGDSSSAEELNILHFGNSFTDDIHTYTSNIISALSVSNVNINASSEGGTSLESYASRLDSNSSVTIHTVCGKSISSSGGIRNVLAHDWDIIAFQQLSSQSGNYSNYIPALAELASAARRYCTNKNVKIAFVMTWGTGGVSYSSIINAVKTLRENLDGVVDIIVPCGTALENARHTSMAEDANSFSADSSIWHLAHGVGEYVAGCAFYCSVIRPFTGKSIYGDTTTTVTTSGGLGEVDVTSENRELCQKCAEYASSYRYDYLDVESLY